MSPTDLAGLLRAKAYHYRNAEIGYITPAELDLAADVVEQMLIDTVPKSWDGLMSILDEVYPADVLDGSSGNPGPRIVVHLRAIDAIRREVPS